MYEGKSRSFFIYFPEIRGGGRGENKPRPFPPICRIASVLRRVVCHHESGSQGEAARVSYLLVLFGDFQGSLFIFVTKSHGCNHARSSSVLSTVGRYVSNGAIYYTVVVVQICMREAGICGF